MVNKQEQMTTKQQATPKIHVNKIHVNINHPIEDMMHATMKNLHHRIKGLLEVYEDCNTVNSNHKLLRKVEKEQDLKRGEMIYLDLISQKNPS